MKKLGAVAMLVTLLLAIAPMPAQAGGAAVNAALALGAFAVLSPFFVLGALAQPFYAPQPVYAAPGAYVTAPAYPVVSSAPAAPPPAVRREVVYAHGRHVLLGDGVRTPYQWVWVPNPPAGTPPAPPSQ
jgi:hypothetical protein